MPQDVYIGSSIHPTIHQFSYSYNYSFIYFYSQPFIKRFIRLFTSLHVYIHPFIHLPTILFIDKLVISSIRSSIYFIYLFNSFIFLHIHSLACSYTHSYDSTSIHLSIHWCTLFTIHLDINTTFIDSYIHPSQFLYTYSAIHLFIHQFLPSFLLSPVHSSICTSLQFTNHVVLYLCIHWTSYSFIRTSIHDAHSYINYSFIGFSIHLFIHQINHQSIHMPIHSSTCTFIHSIPASIYTFIISFNFLSFLSFFYSTIYSFLFYGSPIFHFSPSIFQFISAFVLLVLIYPAIPPTISFTHSVIHSSIDFYFYTSFISPPSIDPFIHLANYSNID